MRTVGERLVEGLAARGVEVVFGIPGVHTVELYRGLSGSGIRHVTGRHEQGCVFMADGYARASGKPGVAFVITGPGLTNALTGMGQARQDSVPILVISGVNRRDSLGRGLGLLHELPDQHAMAAAICPSRRILGPEDVAEALDWAFGLLTDGRPGPVHLEVPTDVMPLPCPALPAPALSPGPALPEGIEAALAPLQAARRPVILAGGGMRHAAKALRHLAEVLDAPVVMTVNARGLLHDHPLAVAASPSLAAVRALIAGSDQILALGTEFGQTDYDMYVRGGLPDMSGMIRVDIDAAQLARQRAALPLQGDAHAAALWLADRLTPRKGDGATRAQTARVAARTELAQLHPLMPRSLEMVEAIRTALPGALIVGDSTQPVYAANLVYDHDLPGGWFNAATGYGTLGFGPGASIGAALARPDRPVVCLVGDGGLQFSPSELRTAVDEKVRVTFLVWNNAGYREIAEAMRDANAEVIGCSPSPLRLEPFAAACDLPFTSIPMEPEVLVWALQQPCDGPRLIEIRVTG